MINMPRHLLICIKGTYCMLLFLTETILKTIKRKNYLGGKELRLVTLKLAWGHSWGIM